jgi:hypothetical protein
VLFHRKRWGNDDEIESEREEMVLFIFIKCLFFLIFYLLN